MSVDFQNWAEKYRATCFWEIKGQDQQIQDIKAFLQSFPEKRGIVLQGPPGIGKTCLAYAAANEMNYEVIELNASDLRNKDQLKKILGEASQQKSFFKKGKILLVDEVDGLSSFKDRGGVPQLISLINETQFPIIMTSNDIWNKKFKDLRKQALLVSLKELDYKTICEILKEISKKQELNIEENALTSIAVKAKGDVRAAINDLQLLASDENVSYLSVDERNKEQSIFNALKIVLKNPVNSDILRIFDTVNMSLDEVYLWLEKNIPAEYSGEELDKAYSALSKADVFRGRIMRNRHWRFLIYQNFLLSGGVSSAKKDIKHGFTKYERPDRILKIWLAKQRNMNKKTIIEKYAHFSHMSKKKAEKEFFVIKNILKKTEIQQELKLNEKEVEFVKSIQ